MKIKASKVTIELDIDELQLMIDALEHISAHGTRANECDHLLTQLHRMDNNLYDINRT